MPNWAKETLKDMEDTAKMVYYLRSMSDLVRLRTGFLLKEIFERAAQKINSTLQPDRTLWMYSAHSSTVTTMLNGLGFSEVRLIFFIDFS